MGITIEVYMSGPCPVLVVLMVTVQKPLGYPTDKNDIPFWKNAIQHYEVIQEYKSMCYKSFLFSSKNDIKNDTTKAMR